jgi:hypothetical protein
VNAQVYPDRNVDGIGGVWFNAHVGVYDQIKRAFQDLIAPELHAIRGDIRLLDQKIDGVDARLTVKVDGLDARLTTKIDSLDQKIDGLDTRLTIKIDSLDQRSMVWMPASRPRSIRSGPRRSRSRVNCSRKSVGSTPGSTSRGS